MNVIFLGFTVTDEQMAHIVEGDAHMPIQTHAFAWSLVDAMRRAKLDIYLLSALPLTSYPGNRQIVVRGGSFSARGVRGDYIPFVNLTFVKHATRAVSALLVGARALKRHRPEVLLVHGVHTPFLLAAAIFRRFFDVRVVTVLTDPAGVVLPSDGRLVAFFKRLDRAIVRALLQRHDGVIALTKPLAKLYASGLPALIMEGIVAAVPPPRVRRRCASSPFVIVYAGGLSRAYGVANLLEAVSELPSEDVRLQLFGRGELEPQIRALASTDSRIEEPRLLDRKDVLRLYGEADVLVQPRPVEQDFVPFSFPSKLLEYLASGTPVVTTRLPGIPEDYDPYVEWAETDTSTGLRESISRVLDMDRDARATRGAHARDFIWRTRGAESQGRRMRDFFNALR